MTKSDIIESFSSKTGISKKESSEMVDLVLELMKNTLASGETLKIAGFGSFVVKLKADRKGRNPQTGETITISSRRILSFKSSPVLKNAINA